MTTLSSLKRLLPFLWSILFFWSASGANLYNFSSDSLSQELERINATYQLNTDVVLLESGDRCALRQDFSDCIRDELDDGVDLVFVINNASRKMETSVRDSALNVIPKADALSFEQEAIRFLQSWDQEWAITAYLWSLKTFLNQRCSFYNDSTCTVTSLTESVRLYEEQKAEQGARQKLVYMQIIVWLILLSALLIWGIQKRQTSQRDQKNLTLLNQLKDHSTFLRMNVRQDMQIFEKDKTDILTELTGFDEKLEHLFSSTKDYIHIQLTNDDYSEILGRITSKYEHILTLIWETPEIRKKIAEIKKFDL